MARPTGWEILDLDGDPTPGAVETVQALAKQFGDFAHDVEAAYSSLNSFGADANAMEWVGQTAEAFKGQFGPLPGRLRKLYISYSEASDALSAYAPALQSAQSKADSALRQAQDAEIDLQRAQTSATSAAADLKTAQQNHAANPNPQAVTDAQTAHDNAQTGLKNAQDHMDALKSQAHQAHNDLEDAGKACAKALHHAQSDGIHNKHWWEHVGEFMSEWGGKIAEIAGEIAPILDVIALATSWIPGVDVITAGLAEADNIVALVGSGLQIAGDAMQGHFKDALLGAGMLGLTYLGGRALGSLGKEAKGMEGEADALGTQERNGVREAEGNSAANEGGDPVDIVSGQMITSSVDLLLPGVFPVVLRRAYASGYTNGRLFGAGWSSTLDQRLSINAAGIHFVGDDAQTLHYPMPVGSEPVLPVRGSRWSLTWDRDSDEIRITNPDNGYALHFDVDHFANETGRIRDVTALSERNGNRIEIVRDSQGTPTALTHPAYHVVIDTVGTAAGPRVRALRLMDGSETGIPVKEYQYDHLLRLDGVVDSTGVPYRFHYDDANRITAWTDRLGYSYEYTYDDQGRVVRGVGMDGCLDTAFEYRDEDRVTVVTDSLGQSTIYHYDQNGHVVAVTDPLGGTATAERDLFGTVLASSDPLGRTTRFQIDDLGLCRRILLPGDQVISLEYNDLNRLTTATGPDGAVWRYGYDGHGNMLTILDPEGAQTSYSYNEFGGLSSVTDAAGHVTSLTVDAAGLSTSVTEPGGATTSVTRDAFGRAIHIEDAAGGHTELWWTIEGGKLARVAPGGAREEWEYDAAGHIVAHRDLTGAIRRYEYGPFDLMTAQRQPDGSGLSYTHDAELRLRTVTNDAGLTWDYDYDPANNLCSENDFNGCEIVYTHDAAGQLLSRRVADGPLVAFERDDFGNVLRRHAGDEVSEFEYDAVGRLTRAHSPTATLEYIRDGVGRLLSESVNGRTVRNIYDGRGLRVRRETPTGVVSSWGFDADGRVAALSGTAANLSFAYDGGGREVERRLGPAAVLRQTYDEAERLSSQHIWASSGPNAAGWLLQQRRYRYDAEGTVTSIEDQLRGDRTFDVDRLGRVTAVHAAGWQERYAYDRSGNLAFATAPTGIPEVQGDRETAGTLLRRAGRVTYDYDSQMRLVRTVRRTLSGRRDVWLYAWDAENRLKTLTEPDGTVWQYAYDPLGRRIGKYQTTANGELVRHTVFAWDGSHLAEQVESHATGYTEVLTWDYEPGSHRAAAQTRRTSAGEPLTDATDAEFHAIVTDLVGTPMELVAVDGTVAWHQRTALWGQAEAASGDTAQCPLRFPGQYHDEETGWNYNLFRYYDPENARYVTPDPMGLAPAPNHYAYVDNPLGATDPLGLITYDQAKKVAKGIQQRAEDGTTIRKAGPPPPEGKGYHGHIDQSIEEEILKNPDAVYYSTGTGDRVIFRRGEDIVVMDGKGATKGHVVTSYGPSGVLGKTGLEAYPNLGLKETDPGRPVTHDMLINGRVPNKKGFLAPAIQIGWP